MTHGRILQKVIQGNRAIFCSSNLSARSCWNNIFNFGFKRLSSLKNCKYNPLFRRQLESIATGNDSSVLLSSKSVYRASIQNGAVRKTIEESGETTRKVSGKKRSEIKVPTQTLPAGTHIYFSFNNLRLRDDVSFYVESEYPVNTYLVDEEGFANFRNGNQFNYYGSFLNQKEHRNRVRVPHQGNWYFIIDNPSQYQNTAIHYDVHG